MTETGKAKIKIEMAKVLYYSKHKMSSGEDSGKLMIARNLDCMKKWTEEEISEIFSDKGNLRNSRPKKPKKNPRKLTYNDHFSRIDLIKNTRREIRTVLKVIFADEDLEDAEMPNRNEYQRMVRELIGAKNIRNKFEGAFIEYNLSEVLSARVQLARLQSMQSALHRVYSLLSEIETAVVLPNDRP